MRREPSSVIDELFLGFDTAGLKVVAVRGGTRRELRAELRKLGGLAFDQVVVVGHGNVDGVVFGSGDRQVADWDEWGDALAGFEPLAVHFVACWAGTSAAADTLFDSIDSLDEIWGSPTKAAPRRAAWITAMLVHARAMEGRTDPSLFTSFAISALSFPMAGEFVRRITWEDREGDDNPGATYAFEDILSGPLNEVREDWKRRNRRG